LAALAIGQYVASLLFQVSPRDPAAFGTASAMLAVSAAAMLDTRAARHTGKPDQSAAHRLATTLAS